MLATRQLLTVLFVLLLTAISDGVAAQMRSTSPPKTTLGVMREWCEWASKPKPNMKADNYVLMGKCLGRLQGYALGHQRLAGTSPEPFRICFPDLRKISPEQLATIFLRWADDHPEEWDLDWSVAYHKAMLTAFPCPEKS